MNPSDLSPEHLLLLILSANGGSISGKTLLQKRAFFVSEHLGAEMGYHAHYFGPYSPVIDAAVGRLKSLGFIDEHTEEFGRRDAVGFEWRKYTFSLTGDGRKVLRRIEATQPETVEAVAGYLQIMRDAGDNGDYVNLSIAAKTIFILSQLEGPINCEELRKTAAKFNWDIKPAQLDSAIAFLARLNLIETGPAPE